MSSPRPTTTVFDEAITGITEAIEYYKKEIIQCDDTVARMPTLVSTPLQKEELYRQTMMKRDRNAAGIDAHQKRIDTLNLMKNNKTITVKQHNDLLLMDLLAEDPNVVNYPLVEKNPAMVSTLLHASSPLMQAATAASAAAASKDSSDSKKDVTGKQKKIT